MNIPEMALKKDVVKSDVNCDVNCDGMGMMLNDAQKVWVKNMTMSECLLVYVRLAQQPLKSVLGTQ